MFARLMGLNTISPARLHALLADRSVTVLDLNSRQSWMRAHVPGARNLNPADYRDNELPADKDAPLVFYCSNPMCRKAPNAARRARKMGYTDVRVMSAGISGWLSAGLSVEKGD